MSTLRTPVKTGLSTEDTASFTTNVGQSITLAREYYNLISDRTQIRSSFKQMWGQGIRQETDPGRVGGDDESDDGSASTGMIEVYDKVDFSIEVDAGMKETISVGFSTKVINAHATLFTEETGKTSLVHSSESTDTKPAEKLLFDQRKKGGYQTAMVRADKLSIGLGSIAVYQNYADGAPTYQYFDKSEVRAFYGETIIRDGKEQIPDRKNIEHATYVIIRLGQVDHVRWNYLAIFGRSEENPLGRWVTYTAGDTINVPEKGSANTTEYVLDMAGEAPVKCNPLSWYADKYPDEEHPEYPIQIIYGGFTEAPEILPSSSSLHDISIEFDRTASHTLSCANDAATGRFIIERTNAAEGLPLPKTSVGPIALHPGQTAEVPASDSASCQTAYTIMRSTMIDAAAGFNVPDYLVVSEDHTLDASSGIALEVKTRPLIAHREFRIDENKESIQGIFEREKILIEMFAKDADDSAVQLLKECDLVWDAGQIRLPENKKEEAERISLLLKDGILDTIGGLREYHKLSSDKEAIELYEKMGKRAKKYPPLNQPEEPPKKEVSLLRRPRTVTT